MYFDIQRRFYVKNYAPQNFRCGIFSSEQKQRYGLLNLEVKVSGTDSKIDLGNRLNWVKLFEFGLPKPSFGCVVGHLNCQISLSIVMIGLVLEGDYFSFEVSVFDIGS